MRRVNIFNIDSHSISLGRLRKFSLTTKGQTYLQFLRTFERERMAGKMWMLVTLCAGMVAYSTAITCCFPKLFSTYMSQRQVLLMSSHTAASSEMVLVNHTYQLIVYYFQKHVMLHKTHTAGLTRRVLKSYELVFDLKLPAGILALNWKIQYSLHTP